MMKLGKAKGPMSAFGWFWIIGFAWLASGMFAYGTERMSKHGWSLAIIAICGLFVPEFRNSDDEGEDSSDSSESK